MKYGTDEYRARARSVQMEANEGCSLSKSELALLAAEVRIQELEDNLRKERRHIETDLEKQNRLDYFAGLAMQNLMSCALPNSWVNDDDAPGLIAKASRIQAEAMIKEFSK